MAFIATAKGTVLIELFLESIDDLSGDIRLASATCGMTAFGIHVEIQKASCGTIEELVAGTDVPGDDSLKVVNASLIGRQRGEVAESAQVQDRGGLGISKQDPVGQWCDGGSLAPGRQIGRPKIVQYGGGRLLDDDGGIDQLNR